jgi:hypothetical protein
MIQAPEIPYERQAAGKMCGAAALHMVYASLGAPVPQRELWPSVTGGHSCARTRLLAADALHRGLSSVILEARDPWQTLQHCQAHHARVVLNHRPLPAAWTGHYTVLVDIDDAHVWLHDPQFGPRRQEPRSRLLELWRPLEPKSEITGNVLVAFDRADGGPAPACSACGGPAPDTLTCRTCQRPFPLRPWAAVGCINPLCSARLWQRLFCPHCDTAHGVEAPAAPESGAAAAPVALNSPKLADVSTAFRGALVEAIALASGELRLRLADALLEFDELLARVPAETLAQVQATQAALEQMRKRMKAIPGEARRREDVRRERSRAGVAERKAPYAVAPASQAPFEAQQGERLRAQLLTRYAGSPR